MALTTHPLRRAQAIPAAGTLPQRRALRRPSRLPASLAAALESFLAFWCDEPNIIPGPAEVRRRPSAGRDFQIEDYAMNWHGRR